MHTTKVRLLHALTALTCISFVGVSTSAAGKIKFPRDEPTFILELPEGWQHAPDKDGNLDCHPSDDSEYTMSILILKGLSSEKELKAALPKIASGMAEAAKIKKFELGDIDSSKNGNDVRFMGIRGDGKVEGVDFVVLVHAFQPQKGKFYAIITAGSKRADDKYEKDYDSITASIEPLE